MREKPALWPEGAQPFSDATGRAIAGKCAELGMPIGMHTQAPFATHADAIESLCRAFPSCAIVLDHFGGTRRWEQVMTSARCADGDGMMAS